MATQDKASEEKAIGVIQEYESMSGKRGTIEQLWLEIAERWNPNHVAFFEAKGKSSSPEGVKNTEKMFDSTPPLALDRFAAILDSLLTPRNQKWHRLVAQDRALGKNRAVQLWFDEVNYRLFQFRYAPSANFAAQNQQIFRSLGAYGTSCLFIDGLYGGPGLRYRSVHLSEVYFAQNHQGIIDKAIRLIKYTARQAHQIWKDKLPEKILEALQKSPESEFYFLHCVKPRLDYDPNRKDFKGKQFESLYVAIEGKKLLQEGGYTTFPYSVPRYVQDSGQIYGQSPAMMALPAVKTLNEEKKTLLKQGHRAVDPTLLAHDDGVINSIAPGTVIGGAVSKDGRPLIHALQPGNIAVGKDMMDDERAVIDDLFLVKLFRILDERPQATATEIMEASREKGILLAPTVGALNSTYLGALIERELDVLSYQGQLPPMPPILQQAMAQYKVEFDSPLSRAQRAEEASGLMRTVESTLNVVNVTGNPEPLDHFDWDQIVPELSDIHGVPTKWLRSQQEVDKIRQARNQQGQMQQAIQAAPGIAAVTKAGAAAQSAQNINGKK